MTIDDAIERIQCIEVEPGDVFVISMRTMIAGDPYGKEKRNELRATFAARFPACTCIILEDGVSLEAVLSDAKDEGDG